LNVGICIPNYNMGTHLPYAVESALNQEYKNVTIYILDNASKDNSWEIILKYKEKYKNIKIFKNTYTLSMDENWTKLLRLAKDEDYINILSSDDRLHTTYIKKCIEMHKTYNYKLGYVYTERHNISNGKTENMSYSSKESGRIPLLKEFELNIKGFVTAPCQLMIKNQILKEIGYLSTQFGIVSDMHMTLKINAKYDVGYIKEPLVDYNMSTGMSSDFNTNKLMAIQFYNLKKDILKNYLPIELRDKKGYLMTQVDLFCAKFCLSRCKEAILHTKYKEARELFYLAMVFDISLNGSKLKEYIDNHHIYKISSFNQIVGIQKCTQQQ